MTAKGGLHAFLRAWRDHFEREKSSAYRDAVASGKNLVRIPVAVLKGTTKFQCDGCGQAFFDGYAFYKHLLMVHKREIYARELQSFATEWEEFRCRACSKRLPYDNYCWYVHLTYDHGLPFDDFVTGFSTSYITLLQHGRERDEH